VAGAAGRATIAGMTQPDQPCPCGRMGPGKKPLPYGQCCGRYIGHFDDIPAPDAESLMRSRYTAHALCDVRYLLDTWYVATRPGANMELDAGTKWLGLEVRDHRVIDGTHAEVEFVARYRVAGRGVRLHERSRFVRDEGRWYYVDGDIQ
jgi:SEC-C motif domain protein